jgi:hypothetical protein
MTCHSPRLHDLCDTPRSLREPTPLGGRAEDAKKEGEVL